jgi:hypothetical protein
MHSCFDGFMYVVHVFMDTFRWVMSRVCGSCILVQRAMGLVRHRHGDLIMYVFAAKFWVQYIVTAGAFFLCMGFLRCMYDYSCMYWLELQEQHIVCTGAIS